MTGREKIRTPLRVLAGHRGHIDRYDLAEVGLDAEDRDYHLIKDAAERLAELLVPDEGEGADAS